MLDEEFNSDHWMIERITELGVSPELASWFTLAIDVIILILIAFIVDVIARKVILRLVQSLVAKSKTEVDDVFFENRVFRGMAHVLPALVILIGAPIILQDFPGALKYVTKLSYVLMVIAIVLVFNAFMNSVHVLLSRNELFKDKPIQSYVQVAKLIGYLVAGVLIISTLIGKSPVVVLSAFGAVAAVLIFVFKDTILGLVASIQISVNDLIRVGDWVSMDKYGADGDVVDISLNTIKVQNWDKTISTIPTYMFTADSFKNWRGMEEAGGRRVKRAINMKISSIKFCDSDMINRFAKFDLLTEYLTERGEEVASHNQTLSSDLSVSINGRKLTNIGVFREYASRYISANANTHQGLTKMVRQLAPTSEGVPIELYFFTKTTEWGEYEQIQSDVFDHLLASVYLFDLEVFESPTGADFKDLTRS
ncbi:MAG: miniconductance mechanosensitive channel [Granulosicoccus sp.]|jgi:miniconductance mechanosensitive channel